MNDRTLDTTNAIAARHWSRVIAEELVSERGTSQIFTCASGITPSGHVHVGNLRDVLTIWFVGQQLRRLGVQVHLLHSWDDFDRFRKVPAGVPDSYKEFIGQPVSKVPDPEGKYPSFAARFVSEFEESVRDLGIDVTFKSQTVMYESTVYGPAILEAVQKRTAIFDIINSFRTQPLTAAQRDAYVGIEAYCRTCLKDGTAIELLDERVGLFRYECRACGNKEEMSILTAGNIKLPWKVDWPMRWRHEGVMFEPGGKDHGTAGGSYFVASEISHKIFNFPAPRFQTYEFIGLKGSAGKMSSSAGTVVTPGEALNVYQPEVLAWLFAKVPPLRAFDLPLDQQLVQIYDEYDKAVLAAGENPNGSEAESISLSSTLPARPGAVPFKTVSSLVALLDGNPAAVRNALTKLGFAADSAEADQRIRKADYWLNTYLPEQRIRLLDSPNAQFISTLPEDEKLWVEKLVQWVKARTSITELEAQDVFQIPVATNPAEAPKLAQRRFFKCVYQLLFARDNGPRLPTFLAAIPAERYLFLLEAAG